MSGMLFTVYATSFFSIVNIEVYYILGFSSWLLKLENLKVTSCSFLLIHASRTCFPIKNGNQSGQNS